jgi:hypothetical protein
MHSIKINITFPTYVHIFLVFSFLLVFLSNVHMHSSIHILPYACYMSFPSHPPWLDHSNKFCEGHNLWSFSLCSFLQPPIISSFFGPNIFVSTLFSNTLSLHSFLNIRDQVYCSYKTTGKIILMYILIFSFLYSKQKDKRFQIKHSQALSKFKLLIISSWVIFWFVIVVSKYFHCATISNDLLATFMLQFCPAFCWRDSNIVSCHWMTTAGVWLGNWIYWTLTERNYK